MAKPKKWEGATFTGKLVAADFIEIDGFNFETMKLNLSFRINSRNDFQLAIASRVKVTIEPIDAAKEGE